MVLKSSKKAVVTFALTLIIAVTFILYPEESTRNLDGPYQVTRVVDGDTIVVAMSGDEKRVRLIGVDTPESVHPDESRNVPYGKIAAEFTRSQLSGRFVFLEYDVDPTDQYGRILAYVWIDDSMFNKTLLREGHAKLATYPPNVKYVDDFKILQTQAREEGRGVWGEN